MYSLDGSTWVWASDSCQITRVLVTGAVSRMTLRGIPRFDQAAGGRWRCAMVGMAFDGGSTLWLALPGFRGKGFGTVVPVHVCTGRVLARHRLWQPGGGHGGRPARGAGRPPTVP